MLGAGICIAWPQAAGLTLQLPASSFQLPVQRQAHDQQPERHRDQVRVQVGEDERPQRKLVDRVRDDPAGGPVVIRLAPRPPNRSARSATARPVTQVAHQQAEEHCQTAHPQRRKAAAARRCYVTRVPPAISASRRLCAAIGLACAIPPQRRGQRIPNAEQAQRRQRKQAGTARLNATSGRCR